MGFCDADWLAGWLIAHLSMVVVECGGKGRRFVGRRFFFAVLMVTGGAVGGLAGVLYLEDLTCAETLVGGRRCAAGRGR